ncbi:hypothetical protein J26TS2_30300 [Shouchella clausii]|nr:hypothetical protein J26TS2_30300 [Shouchella clausii]
MPKRKAIKKSVRFEVFKRDSFKCQYCGASSPDVLLHIDHIKPVAEGGGNDITNLVTACADCNLGKGKRLLDDNSTLEKQRKQLEELNERRQQLEMMMEWREELQKFDEEVFENINAEFVSLTGSQISESGKRKVLKWLKKFDVNEILDAMEASVNAYLDKGAEEVFDAIPKICTNKRKYRERPELREFHYIRGILRNRLPYVNDKEAVLLMEEAYRLGATIDSMKDVALHTRNWSSFRDTFDYFIAKAMHEGVGKDE